MSKEENLRLSIEKLVHGGYGLAHHRDKVVLVRFAAPRELVDVEVIQEKKDYSEAYVKDVILSSASRREAPCPYFGVCGGCQLQHVDYNTQVESKESILLETLQRIGKIREVPLGEAIQSGQEFGYRVRVQFKVKNGKLGFYRWDEHEIVDIEHCPIAHPRINELIKPLKECVKYIRELQEIHVTYSPSEDKFLVKFVTPTEIDREFLGNLKRDCLPEDVVGVGDYSRLRTILNRRFWIGKEYLFIDVGKWKFRVSSDSFFQVNWTLWESFIRAVSDVDPFRKAIDLHCGVGFFTIPLSEKGNFIEGSDSNPWAINDAEYNAKLNNRDNVVFIKSDAYRHLKNRGGEVLDLVVLDPPRSGLERKEIDLLVNNQPERIVYISCNPATLARDLKALLKGGYRLEQVKLVDMFPQTYHIESVSYLRVQA
ncbi:class I SAM-dependent RNA methyltransferase [Hydrogenivirga caldilitoris]|uniref:class I SAM-dependent RNA methyltransferase n=1 Tax=Hydrogenivirga caldilitoris TaxID=246264 RepID=UPI000EAF4AF3|nr:class I SAM-dependent RNA methyltransferase [Hydrogenivirga caldilitoris]